MPKRANICCEQKMSYGVINAIAGKLNFIMVLLQEVRVPKIGEETIISAKIRSVDTQRW